MIADNASINLYNLKLRAKQTRRRIRARNKAQMRHDRFSPLDMQRKSIGVDYNATFQLRNNSRLI